MNWCIKFKMFSSPVHSPFIRFFLFHVPEAEKVAPQKIRANIRLMRIRGKKKNKNSRGENVAKITHISVKSYERDIISV